MKYDVGLEQGPYPYCSMVPTGTWRTPWRKMSHGADFSAYMVHNNTVIIVSSSAGSRICESKLKNRTDHLVDNVLARAMWRNLERTSFERQHNMCTGLSPVCAHRLTPL